MVRLDVWAGVGTERERGVLREYEAVLPSLGIDDEAAGARTQLSGVVGALAVALLLLVAPNLLKNLPIAPRRRGFVPQQPPYTLLLSHTLQPAAVVGEWRLRQTGWHPRPREHLIRAQRFSRHVYERLRAFDEAALRAELAREPDPPWPILNDAEIVAVLQRRDFALAHIERMIAAHGRTKVLCFP
jgi:hypothetical protein